MAISELLGPAVGVLTGVVTGNPAAGLAAGTAISSATAPKTNCPGQPNDQAAILLRKITPEDFADLRRYASAASGPATAALDSRDPVAVAFHIAGGDDCKVTTATGRAWVARFWELFDKYNGASAAPVPAPNVGGSTGIFDQLWQGIKDFGTSIAGGAVQGATDAATAGGTAARGAVVARNDTVLLLAALGVAALIIVPLLRK